MAIKALTAGFFGLLALSGSTCQNPSTSDAPKDKPTTPEVVLEGVDTAALTAREKKEWSSYVSEFLSPCPSVPVPIAQCVKEKRDCSRCLPAAKYVLRGVKDGLTREQIEKSYKNRFDADKIKNVPLDASPVKGPEGAPITIVEFADFECPHCGQVAPMIDQVVEGHKNDVRFAFKFYPLPGHPHADIAARAGVAAMRQGKFWEMHHLLFTNQQHLEQTDLDSYAKQLGMDVSRFHADMQSPETTDRIAKDKKLGEDVQISGTPSIFINGRQFDGRQEMNEWIALELSSMGKPTETATKGDAGAATSATSAPSAPSATGSAAGAKSDAGAPKNDTKSAAGKPDGGKW